MPATTIVATPTGYRYTDGSKVNTIPNGVVRITTKINK